MIEVRISRRRVLTFQRFTGDHPRTWLQVGPVTSDSDCGCAGVAATVLGRGLAVYLYPR